MLEDIGTWTAALSLLCQDEQQNHTQKILHFEGIQVIYNFIWVKFLDVTEMKIVVTSNNKFQRLQ